MNEIDKGAPFSKLILQIALGERKQRYDPRTSLWQSVDSALGEYIGNPSWGRVYNPANLSLYTFAGQKPLKYVDPDGGKFTIAKAIQAQFNEAIKYLSTSSEAKAVLDALESSPVEFKIQHSNETVENTAKRGQRVAEVPVMGIQTKFFGIRKWV